MVTVFIRKLFSLFLAWSLLLPLAAAQDPRTGRTQDRALDSKRTGFAPASVRFANLAAQDVTTWSALTGAASVTTGITAPDGTTAAAKLSTTLPTAYKRVYGTTRTFAVGDWVIAGVWVKAVSLQSGLAELPTATLDDESVATLKVWDETEGYQFNVDSLNYRALTASDKADTEWEWVSTAAKITRIRAGGQAELRLDLECTVNRALAFYAPILLHVPSGQLTDDEAQSLLQNLYSVPDGALPGTVATLKESYFQSKLVDAGGAAVNVRAFGADGSDTTSDSTAVAAAVAKAATLNLPVQFPAGTYYLSNLTITDSVTLIGAGKGKTIIQSDGSNSPIIQLSSNGNRTRVRGLTIQGTSAGASQHGIYINGASPSDVVIEDIDVLDVGGAIIKVDTSGGALFSSVIRDVTGRNWNMSATSGLAAFDLDTDGPSVLLVNCYPKDTSSGAAAIGFRIRRGQTRTIKLENCNGIDPSGSGSINAIVGQDTAFGDASTSVAYVTFSNCNFEAFTATGIEVRGSGSVINLIGANQFVAGATGVRPIWFRSATIAGASPGILDPQTLFANADTAGATYANGEAIESEGIPPLILLAPAGQFGSFNGVLTYWDTSLATDKSVPLRRLDALNRVAPTATYTVESQGTRLVDMRHSGAGVTVTLMYGGYLRPGEWVVVKDGSGIAATHNITVNAGGGSTIDGAASATINTNYGSLLVYSDGTNYLTFGGGNSSGGGSGANTALSNLASVAINTSLLPGTDNAIDAGSSSKQFRNGYFGTGIVMGTGATTYAAQNLTITAGSNPQYAFSDGTVSGRFQLLGGSYLQLGTTTNHNTLFLHNGTGVFTLRAIGLIPETTNTYQLGGDGNRWTDGYFYNSVDVGRASTATGKLVLRNSTNSNTLTIQPGATGSSLTWTLPTSNVTDGYLKNNGSGTLSFDALTHSDLAIPYAEVEASGTQSITSSTLTYLNFATEIADTDTMHDTVTNNSRITATTAGKYVVTATVPWDDLGGAQFRILTRIYKNRTDVVAGVDYVLPNVTTQFPSFNVSGMVALSAGDYVEVAVYHEYGSAKSTYNASGLKPKFSAVRVQ